jgi:hypothetical protein
MKTCKKTTIFILVICFLILNFSPCLPRSLEEQLKSYDQLMAQKFSKFPQDTRYDNYLADISKNLNRTLVGTFGENKNISYLVCASNLGFNAVSFHRLIVLDSLLLDTLRFLARAKVYYGTIDNPYVNRLIFRVSLLHGQHQAGMMNPGFVDQNNPFNLPVLPGQLTPEQEKQAETLFINMLASWMAHEGSHCMRDHLKYRFEIIRKRQQESSASGNQAQVMDTLEVYTNSHLSQELEREADLYAVNWLLNSGYNVDGFILWLSFGEKLEQASGLDNAYFRTHPSCTERIRYIREAAGKRAYYLPAVYNSDICGQKSESNFCLKFAI